MSAYPVKRVRHEAEVTNGIFALDRAFRRTRPAGSGAYRRSYPGSTWAACAIDVRLREGYPWQ